MNDLDAARANAESSYINPHKLHPYSSYFSSGHYDSRYPRPNSHVLFLIGQVLQGTGLEHVIDFGSGNGRYVIPLLQRYAITATAIDRDDVARAQLAERAMRAGVIERLTIHADLDELPVPAARSSLVLTMFGVLAHITDTDERRGVLSRLSVVAGSHGHLVASVPNRARRFIGVQLGNFVARTLPAEDVIYSRRFAGRHEHFAYRLFSTRTLVRELKCAGFAVRALRCESLLPERMVTNSTALGYVDQLLSRHAPAVLGYGIVAIATR
jgi:tRNA (uracil-5-)-methyltransferase TRM9